MKTLRFALLLGAGLAADLCTSSAQTYSWSTFAGSLSGIGNNDGTGSAARFNNPSSVAIDASSNLYVADPENHAIRKITPGGVVTTLSRGVWISGVAVDASGNVFYSSSNVVQKITPAGEVTTLAGMMFSWGSADGTGSAARFGNLQGIVVDSGGNVFVADSSYHTIRKITSAGVVTTLAGSPDRSGSVDGTGSAAQIGYPWGLAVDSGDNLYVAAGNTIRKVTPSGVVTTLAGLAGSPGSTDGTGAAARFFSPVGVAVDGNGNVFVADTFNSTIRKITPAGVVTTLAGLAMQQGGVDGTGSAARFRAPSGVAVDAGGIVYVADTGNSMIRRITGTGAVTTFAGSLAGSADGSGSDARFKHPWGLALDSNGNLFVADAENRTIRKITAAGVVTTLAGLAGSPGSTDGTAAAARFSFPTGVAVDGGSNVFVADLGNHCIRKVTSAGVVTTIAGRAGNPGSIDGAVTHCWDRQMARRHAGFNVGLSCLLPNRFFFCLPACSRNLSMLRPRCG